MTKKRILPIFIPEAGCTRSCVYCNQYAITGKKVKIDYKQIEIFLSNILSTFSKETFEVAFYGGTFTGLPLAEQIKLLELIKPYVERGSVTHIRLSTRPDLINLDVLELLKAHHVGHIELGVQSTDDEVLRCSGRTYTRNDIINSSHLIKSFGIRLGLQMMLGLPGDSFDKVKQTASDIVHLQPDGVRIYPTVVLKNTLLARWYHEGGYNPLPLDEAIEQSIWLYDFFTMHDVKIYKIGIHPGKDLEKNLLAGPYHPNFHQLVKGEFFYRRITPHLRKDLINYIYSHSSNLTDIVGYERKNLLRWLSRGYRCKVVPDNSLNNELECYVCHS